MRHGGCATAPQTQRSDRCDLFIKVVVLVHVAVGGYLLLSPSWEARVKLPVSASSFVSQGDLVAVVVARRWQNPKELDGGLLGRVASPCAAAVGDVEGG
jgi:hypothetical protein